MALRAGARAQRACLPVGGVVGGERGGEERGRREGREEGGEEGGRREEEERFRRRSPPQANFGGVLRSLQSSGEHGS